MTACVQAEHYLIEQSSVTQQQPHWKWTPLAKRATGTFPLQYLKLNFMGIFVSAKKNMIIAISAHILISHCYKNYIMWLLIIIIHASYINYIMPIENLVLDLKKRILYLKKRLLYLVVDTSLTSAETGAVKFHLYPHCQKLCNNHTCNMKKFPLMVGWALLMG